MSTLIEYLLEKGVHLKFVSTIDNQFMINLLRKNTRKTIIFLFYMIFTISIHLNAQTNGTNALKKQTVFKQGNRGAIEQELENHRSEKSNSQILWNIGLKGDHFENRFEQHSLTHFYLQSLIDYRLLSTLSFNFIPRFSYTTGYILNRNQSSANSSQINVLNASAIMTPFQNLTAEVGALNQSTYLDSILISDSTFPALRITLKNENIGITSESAIASSTSMTTQTNNNQKTPTFNTVGVFAQIKNSWMKANTTVSYFEFKDLPLSVSTNSVLNGNSGQNTSGIDSEFIYQYQGLLVHGEIQIPITQKLDLGTQFSVIQNQQAPDQFNLGYRGLIYSNLFINKEILITPTVEYFEIHSDATVANYNDSSMNTNRAGYRIGLTTSIQNKLKISLTAGERSVLVENPNQENEKMIHLKMETMYVPLF